MKKITNTLEAASSYIKSHKPVSFLAVILLVIIGNFAYNKYLDWDNAQMIKGLSHDFPVLVKKVETATGLDLEIQSNCIQTQEKFSDGVSICEYSIVESDLNSEDINTARNVVLNSDKFTSAILSENERAYQIKYRNKNSCQLSNLDRVLFSCVTGVRDANKGKLSELLQN